MAKQKKENVSFEKLVEGLSDGTFNLDDLKTNQDPRDAKIELMARALWGMRFNDEYGIDNYFMDQFMGAYVGQAFGNIFKWFNDIFTHQKSKRRSYGDIDYSFTKAVDTDTKKVLLFEHHCSCAEITKAVLIWSYDGFQEEFHIRKAWTNTDYKTINQKNKYVQRPGLKWYKDRGYELKHKENLHWGPLGGSYGDLRDKGYVLSAKRYSYSLDKSKLADKPWDFERGMIDTLSFIRFVAFNLQTGASEARTPED